MRKDAKTKTARRLRKNLTKPELWLWLHLKERAEGKPIFRNQHPIGPYVLDFYCPAARLCIEVDGEIHTREAQRERDKVRDDYLARQGIHTYRIYAVDLLADPDGAALGVIELAVERIAGLSPSHHPSDGSPSP